jgi:hypothetical protein
MRDQITLSDDEIYRVFRDVLDVEIDMEQERGEVEFSATTFADLTEANSAAFAPGDVQTEEGVLAELPPYRRPRTAPLYRGLRICEAKAKQGQKRPVTTYAVDFGPVRAIVRRDRLTAF